MIAKPPVIQIIAGFSLESPLGGVERFVFNLCERLKKLGYPIEIYGMWSFGTSYELGWKRKLRDAGIITHTGADWDPQSPYSSFWHSFVKMRKDLSRRNFSIVHSHDQFGNIIAPLIKKKVNAKILLRTVHNEFEWKNRPLRRVGLTHMYYPFVYDAEIGVSKSISQRLNRRVLARLLGRKSTHIMNAVELNRFEDRSENRTSSRNSLKLSESTFVIGLIGRMTEQKGFGYAIQAIPHVLSTHPNTHFVIIGAGELEDVLKQQVKNLDIQNSVLFTGPRSDIDKLLPAFDLFVSSSLWEGLPTVILEAMAFNVPVVATNISGTNELIQDKITGWLVPEKESLALASAICEAIQNPGLREEFSREALTSVKGFSMENAVKHHDDLYLNLLDA